jgi:hypothetical protein
VFILCLGCNIVLQVDIDILEEHLNLMSELEESGSAWLYRQVMRKAVIENCKKGRGDWALLCRIFIAPAFTLSYCLLWILLHLSSLHLS